MQQKARTCREPLHSSAASLLFSLCACGLGYRNSAAEQRPEIITGMGATVMYPGEGRPLDARQRDRAHGLDLVQQHLVGAGHHQRLVELERPGRAELQWRLGARRLDTGRAAAGSRLEPVR